MIWNSDNKIIIEQSNMIAAMIREFNIENELIPQLYVTLISWMMTYYI